MEAAPSGAPGVHIPVPARLIIGWADGIEIELVGDLAPRPDSARDDLVLDALAPWIGHERLERLRRAVAGGDPPATNVLDLVSRTAVQTLDDDLDWCAEMLAGGALADLATWGPRVAALAHAVGDEIRAAAAHGCVARGLYAARRLPETVVTYDLAIGALGECDPIPAEMMAAQLDNRGLALREMGRLDEAIESYRAARRFADDPSAALQIDGNLADALVEIGEYDLALRVLDAVARDSDDQNVDPTAFAVFQDNLALAFARAGDDERAIALYEASEQLLAEAPRKDRIVNAGNRAAAYARLERMDQAREAFHAVQQLWLEDLRERIDYGRFAEAMTAAQARLVPADGEVWQTLEAARAAHDPALTRERYERAARGAEDAGDLLTELICQAALADILNAFGGQASIDAQERAIQVRDRALKSNLTVPAVLADITLCSIYSGGGAPDPHIDPWQVAIEAVVLSTLDDELREQLSDDARERIGRLDVGIPLVWLADKAFALGEHDFAISHYQDAVQLALQAESPAEYVIRATSLIEALGRAVAAGAETSEDYALEQQLQTDVLRQMLEEPFVDARSRLIGYTSLGRWAADRDPARALEDHLRAFRILSGFPAGTAKGDEVQPAAAGESTILGVCRPLLLSMIACDEDDAAAFEVLQWIRARELMIAYAQRRDPASVYTPPDAAESIALVSRMAASTTLVDIVGTRTGLRAYLVDASGVRSVDAEGDTLDLYTVHFGDVRRRAAEAVALVRRSPVLRDLVAAIEDAVEPDHALLVVLDDAISNTPLHAIPYRHGSWSDIRSIGRIPAVGVLRHSAGRAWGGTGVVAGDSRGDLPHAAAECEFVGAILGVRPVLRDQCTLAAVEEELQGHSPDVIHLAVHGRADVRRGGRASLLFASDDGETQWAGVDDLLRLPWEASLIVFSGCSTAVGGPHNGRGLYGIAQVAAEAGATATIASLWPVDDESTRVFMSHFYETLGRCRADGGWVDLRRLLDDARRHLRQWLAQSSTAGTARIRDGRDFGFLDAAEEAPETAREQRDVLHWAPFVVIGDPILRFAS